MKKLLFILLIFENGFFCAQTLSINNQKTFDFNTSDIYSDLIELNGFYYVFGNISVPNKNGDLHLVKMDFNFNIINEFTYGSVDAEVKPLVQVRNDTIFVAVGTTGTQSGDLNLPSNGFTDIWVLALDANLSIIWQNLLGGSSSDELEDFILLNNNDLLILSSSYSGIDGNKTVGANNTTSDPWIIALNSKTGAISKQQAITNDFEEEGYGTLTQSSATNNIYLSLFVVSDQNNSFDSPFYGNGDAFVIEFDENLTKLRDKSFGGNEGDGLSIKYSNGFFYMYGSTNSGISGNKTSGINGISDAWFLKLDENLDVIIDKTFGGTQEQAFLGLHIAGDNLIFAGISNSQISGNKTCPNYGLIDIWVVITDLDGNILNQESYGGSSSDFFDRFIVNSNNDLILISNSNSPISGNKTQGSTNNDLWILELESSSILKVNTISSEFFVAPYPNPFQEEVNFDFSKFKDEIEIYFYSVDGKLLKNNRVKGGTKYKVQLNSADVIFYKIITSEQIFMGKLVKSNN